MVSDLDVGCNRVLNEMLTREEALIAHTHSKAFMHDEVSLFANFEIAERNRAASLLFGFAEFQPPRRRSREIAGIGSWTARQMILFMEAVRRHEE